MLAWLLELLPLLLRALLAALAALLTAMVLPPGGVIWRLPPELSYQLGGVGQAHAVVVQLADAALAMIIALVGFGHIASPRAGLQALPPRAVAPRLAVAVLINQGSLAMGAWVIDLHTPCLGAMTPSSLVAFDPGAWVQAGPDGLMLGVLYALAGLLLALGGWPRVALVDVLLVGAPVLAVSWLLPLTADWGEWALRLFGQPPGWPVAAGAGAVAGRPDAAGAVAGPRHDPGQRLRGAGGAAHCVVAAGPAAMAARAGWPPGPARLRGGASGAAGRLGPAGPTRA